MGLKLAWVAEFEMAELGDMVVLHFQAWGYGGSAFSALLVAPPVARVFDFVQNMVPLPLPCTAQCTQCFPRLLIITTITVLTCFIRCGTGAVVRRRLGAIRALHDGQKQVFVPVRETFRET